MGTIYKYVQEQVSVLDKNYVPILTRKYYSQQEQINENVFYKIKKPLIGNVTKEIFYNDIFSIKSCFIYKQSLDNIVNISSFSEKTKQFNTIGVFTKYYNVQQNFTYFNKQNPYLFVNKLIWLEFNNNDSLWERKTLFEYYNPTIITTQYLDLCLVSGYNKKLTIIEANSLFGVYFDNIHLPQVIEPNSRFCFRIKIDINSPYLDVDNKWIALKVDDGEKQFYLKWHICIKRVPLANAYVLYPDKNSYSETYFFNTFSFRSVNGVETHYPTMDNPKINFNAKYSHLDLYKHKFGENVVLQNERQKIKFPLWSEYTKTIESKEKTSIIRIEKLPKTITIGSKLFLIEEETKAFNLTVVRIVDNNTIQVLEQVTYKKGQIVVPAIETFIKNNTSINRELKDNSFSITLSSTKVVKDLK